jgi:error-prone DNA polymerase
MRRAFDLLAEHKDIRLDLATFQAEDPRTYAMIRKADTLGTFQIESRAQMVMLPRIKPRSTISSSRSPSCGRGRSG